MTIYIKKIQRAIRGGIRLLAGEQTIHVIALLSVCVIGLGLYAGITRAEWVLISIPLCIIFIAEGMNTVVERIIDLVEPRYADHIKDLKDGTAGVVLVAGLYAIVVWYIVFSPYLSGMLAAG